MEKLAGRIRRYGRALGALAAGVGMVVALSSTTPAFAAGGHSASCTGVNAAVGTDYRFIGAGYQAGARYTVTISVPNGTSFTTVATADASGGWSEYWLGSLPGTYRASVATYHSGSMLGSCSLVVS